MSNSKAHPYQPQIATGGQQQQSFNPYDSYASSTATYYDPQQQNSYANSKPSTYGHAYASDFQRPELQNAGASESAVELGQYQNQYGASKQQPYPSGGYAQGPPRSPSPTPSELEAAKRGVIDWKVVLNWRTYAKKKYIPWYIGGVLILVLVALMTLYHKQIVHWLTPAANWMHNLKFGWLIPIAVMFVISFPPLFGHEIVAVLCGLVWGLGPGFGIVAAGTLLGEIGNFYAFKYCLSSRGEKLEREKLSYACLARVVREGGFKIALIARLSAIPGHFTTAVFSVCGMGIVVFTIAAILSLPKQFITVYLGVLLEQSNDTPAQQAANQRSRIISDVVLAITFLVTVAAGWYIWREMNRVQPAVMKERRLAKKKLAAPSHQETQHLARASNADLSSEEEMTPVKPNEARMGAFGYSGLAQSNMSHDTFATRHDANSVTHGYPPSNYHDPYSQKASYGQSNYPPSEEYQHSKVSTDPPHIGNVPNLTGSRRTGKDGTDTTVGMGSWGGILKEGSDASTHESSYHASAPSQGNPLASMKPGSPTTPRPAQPQQQQFRDGADEYGMMKAPGGLSALGAPMGNAGTVSVTPRNVPAARRSVEQSGIVGGKSMRAVVETSDDSDLSYMQASPPNKNNYLQQNMSTPTAASFRQAQAQAPKHFAEPATSASGQSSSSSYHTGLHGTDASKGTFGDQQSLHSRQYAATGSSSGEETYIPGGYR